MHHDSAQWNFLGKKLLLYPTADKEAKTKQRTKKKDEKEMRQEQRAKKKVEKEMHPRRTRPAKAST